MQNNRREIPVPKPEVVASKKEEGDGAQDKGAKSDGDGDGAIKESEEAEAPKEEGDDDANKADQGDEEGDDGGNWKRRKLAKENEDEEEEEDKDFPPESELIADFADGHEEE